MKNKGLKTVTSIVITASMIVGSFVMPMAAEGDAATAEGTKNVWVDQTATIESFVTESKPEVAPDQMFESDASEADEENAQESYAAGAEPVDGDVVYETEPNTFDVNTASDSKNTCKIGNDTYQFTCSNIPYFSGYTHEWLWSKKKKASKDLNIVVKKNGSVMSSDDYTLKYKNNKFATGFKQKSPECYIKLGKGADKEAKKVLKKAAMSFDIRPAILDYDIDVSKTVVKYRKNLLTGERKITKYVFYDTKGNEMKYSVGTGGGKNIQINYLSRKSGHYEIAYKGDGVNVLGSGTASFTLF